MHRFACKFSPLRYLLFATPLLGQTPQPRFEVTSVKPFTLTAATAVPPGCPGGRFAARFGLPSTILWAYGIQPFQLDGIEKWPNARASFAIEAASAAPVSESQCRLMVQTLLADRFKLAIHREPRPFSVYALSPAKSGPKLKQATDADPEDGVHINGAQTYGLPKGWSMAQLAELLGRSLYPTPVVDKTGLEGIYRFTLNFAPGPYNIPGVEPRGDGPDIFSAVESQLGLKLEQRKEPIEFVVIDHVEAPDAN
jgi:uncharacterized protein (TIGR03435 family)